MRAFSTVSVLTILLSAVSMPALAQDVFMRSAPAPEASSENGVPSEPPPAPDSFLPFANSQTQSMGTAAAPTTPGDSELRNSLMSGVPQPAPSSPLQPSTQSTNAFKKASGRYTPEEYKRAEQQAKQLAQQYPEMRVNGFTINDDIQTLTKYQTQIAQSIQQACGLPRMPNVVIDAFSFFRYPKATENFPKVGQPFITQVVSQACNDSKQKQALVDLSPIIQLRNVPGTKTPGFDNDRSLILYVDDFTKAEPPGFAVVSNQLRRTLESFSEASLKNSELPASDVREMQRKMDEYEKAQAEGQKR